MTIYARSLPYRTTPGDRRACDRCGITYQTRRGRLKQTHCKDCRGIDK